MPHWPWSPHPQPDTVHEVLAALAHLHDQLAAGFTTLTARIDTMSQTDQQHADALTAQLDALDGTLKAGVAAITAEIAALKGANPAVNFAPLDAAVAALGTDVAAVTAAAVP
jgi:hypothetical protein